MTNIREHYKEQVKKHGLSKQSTMMDINTRNKEVEYIIKHLRILMKKFKNPKILEIGCGNGYTAEQIVNSLNVKSLVCIDFLENFIKLVKKRNLKNIISEVGNVLNLKYEDSSFNIVFTERCLINLGSWEDQQQGLNEIYRILEKGGYYLMIECFTDGLNNINEARNVLGLNSIPQPFHNLYFDKEKFFHFIKGKFEKITVQPSSENFLSSYFFGSRVLYPALIQGKKDIVYNNKFVEFFKYLPSYGNYSYIQKFLLKRI